MMDQTPDSPPELASQGSASGQNQGASSTRANSTSNGATGNGGSSGGDKAGHSAPGSSWNNKKYKEEYEIAASRLCHQDYEPGGLCCGVWNVSRGKC